MGILEDKWRTLAKATMPNVSHDSVQYRNTRDAFYAGASVMMGVINHMGKPDVPAEEAVCLLATIEEELRAFMTVVMEKAAEVRRRRVMRN